MRATQHTAGISNASQRLDSSANLYRRFHDISTDCKVLKPISLFNPKNPPAGLRTDRPILTLDR